jgi:ABC-type amino acid transport system permease subunit
MSATPQSQSDRGLLRRFLYNREVRSVITQIVVVMLVFALFYEIATNLLTNLAAIRQGDII